MLHAFGDGSLFGEMFTNSPARVVALHGWGRTSADFRTVLRGLDAVALDLPGFGASPPPPRAWGAGEYAEAILPALQACSLPVTVVGHSFGGRVAVHLAASHPELVHGLVLTGVPLLRPPGSGARSSRGFRLARRLHAMGLLSDETMERRRRRSGSADYRAADGVMREVLVRTIGEDYSEQLRAITCPVELVWGQTDTAAPVSMAEVAAALLGAPSRLSVLPGVGHDTLASAPTAVRAAIDAQLERL